MCSAVVQLDDEIMRLSVEMKQFRRRLEKQEEEIGKKEKRIGALERQLEEERRRASDSTTEKLKLQSEASLVVVLISLLVFLFPKYNSALISLTHNLV